MAAVRDLDLSPGRPPADPVPVKRSRSKSHAGGGEPEVIQVRTRDGVVVGYTFKGDPHELSRLLDSDEGFDTVVVPRTPKAKETLKKALRAIGPRTLSLRKPEPDPANRPKAAGETASTRIAVEVYQPDARGRAVLRGKAYAAADLEAAGGAYDVEEVRLLLDGVSRQAVDKRIKEGALLAVPGPSGRRRFPTLQFNPDGRPVVGLKQVTAALRFASPWAVLNFLVNDNDQLGGRRPIDALRDGQVETVVAAASAVGVQAA